MTGTDRWPSFLEDAEAAERDRQSGSTGGGGASTGGSGDGGDGGGPGDPAPRTGEHRRPRRTGARVAHVFGEVLVTLGAVMLLFVGYQLWWTGVETQQAQGNLKDDLLNEWEPGTPQPGQTPPAPGETPPPDETIADPEIGDGIAVLRIPRLGPSWAWVVVEGIGLDNLADGPGHYPESAMPGEFGNFAVAGHRATHGEPFARFEELEVGDEVVVETENTWYTYTIYNIDYPVPITSSWAVGPGASPEPMVGDPTRQLMTMTTCHPRWASTFRFLVFSELTATSPKVDANGAEILPPALQALGG